MQNLNEYWKSRRTIRSYSSREISNEFLQDMIDKAAQAPTTGNMQLYSVIVTRDTENCKTLATAHFNQPASVNAPILLTFCADFNRFVKWCEASDAVPGYDNFQSFVAAMLDVTIFAQQFNTIAELNGLGCCYLGTTTYNAPQIAEILKLPELVVPVVTLSLGYPADESLPSDRIPVKAIIHNESYRQEDANEIRNNYFREKEELPESSKFVKENGKQTLAQVFTDIRYSKQNNETFSKIYYDFIDKAGFHWPI